MSLGLALTHHATVYAYAKKKTAGKLHPLLPQKALASSPNFQEHQAENMNGYSVGMATVC